MGQSKLLLALFCNKILTKSEQGVVVVVISWRSDCVTLTVTLRLYRGGKCDNSVKIQLVLVQNIEHRTFLWHRRHEWDRSECDDGDGWLQWLPAAHLGRVIVVNKLLDVGQLLVEILEA